MSGTSGAPDALDLAALLSSRVCHDLINPVGAIVNGLEVMDSSNKAEDKEFALDLIRKSAVSTSARLQFCRIAYGAAGSAGTQIDLGDAQKVARGHLEDAKTKLTWNLPHMLLAKNRVKLLLNMLVIAQQSIPRGGSQGCVARTARGIFGALTGRMPCVDAPRVQRHLQRRAHGAAMRLESVGRGLQPVVHVDRVDAARPAQHGGMQQSRRIGAAAEGDAQRCGQLERLQWREGGIGSRVSAIRPWCR